MSNTATEQDVKGLIKEKLSCFEEAINLHDRFDIDTYDDESEAFKILDHTRKDAVMIKLGTVIENTARDIITAIETRNFKPLHGITRIVGYYSRTNNWNKSKIGELKDRHNGVYGQKGNTWE